MSGTEKPPQNHNDTLVFFVNGKKVTRVKAFYRRIMLCRYAWTMWTCVCHWPTIYGMSVCWVDRVHILVCSASDGHEDRLQRRRLRCMHGGCRHVFIAHARCRLSIRERLFVSRVRGAHATRDHCGGCVRASCTRSPHWPGIALHAVQQRMTNMHASQCGFCTPGFVMAMYGLLRRSAQPTCEQIDDAIQGVHLQTRH